MKHFQAAIVCLLLASAPVQAYAVKLQVWAESCNGNDGAIFATPEGGVAPYTYLWSTGSVASSITGLTAGFYLVTVTDNTGAQSTASYNLPVFDGSVLNDLVPLIGTGGMEPCLGQCNGGFRLHLPRVLGGYSISTVPMMNYVEGPEDEPGGIDQYITCVFTGPACDGLSISLSVNNACGAGGTDIPIVALPLPLVDLQEITGSCNGADDGIVQGQVTIFPGMGGFSQWNLYVLDDQGGSLTTSFWFTAGTMPLQVNGLHPGNWFLQFTSIGSGNCMSVVPVSIPDLGADCSSVSGVLHFETDVDCVQDGLEVGIPNQLLRITPGPLYGITANDGSYEIAAPYGSYDIEQLNPDVVQLCPAAGPVPFSVSSGSNAIVDFSDSVSTPFNMRVRAWSSISRVGFPFNYQVYVSNDNGYVGENLVVTLDYDPLFTYISASAGVSSNTPGQIQWTIPVLGPFAHQSFYVSVQVPPDPGLLGSSHVANATVTSSTSEVDLGDNTDAHVHTIISSFDPNDIQAFTSSRTYNNVYLQDVDTNIDYLIRFQNTGNDTAFNITVADTISPLLDMASLRLLGASHAFTPSIGTGNVLRFAFNNILLPDSNENEAASHGYVAFRLKPVEGIAIGSIINSAADIFFDFNEAVRTNTSSVEVGITTGLATATEPSLSLSPVPALDQLTLRYEGVVTAITIRALDGRSVIELGGARTIDVSRLSPGVYLLQARDQRGSLLQARFVKR